MSAQIERVQVPKTIFVVDRGDVDLVTDDDVAQAYGPRERRSTTKWHNPTKQVQRVDVMVPCDEMRVVQNHETGVISIDPSTGQPRRHHVTQKWVRIVWQPDQWRELVSVLDTSVHDVRDCSHPPPCRPQFPCRRPNDEGWGVLSGGLAPLLVRENQKYSIDRCLIPKIENGAPRLTASPQEVAGLLSGALDSPTATPEDIAMARARARRGSR